MAVKPSCLDLVGNMWMTLGSGTCSFTLARQALMPLSHPQPLSFTDGCILMNCYKLGGLMQQKLGLEFDLVVKSIPHFWV